MKKHVLFFIALVSMVNLYGHSPTRPFDFGLSAEHLDEAAEHDNAAQIISQYHRLNTLDDARLADVINDRVNEYYYDRRMANTKKVIRNNLVDVSWRPSVGAMGVASLAQLIKTLATWKSPKWAHKLNNWGIGGGIVGGLISLGLLRYQKKKVMNEVTQLNKLIQLSDDRLVAYVNDLQTSLELEDSGLPQAYIDVDERIHIPAKIVHLLREFQHLPFTNAAEGAEYLRERIRPTIIARIKRLRRMHRILAPMSAFFWTTAGLSAAQHPWSNANNTTQQPQPTTIATQTDDTPDLIDPTPQSRRQNMTTDDIPTHRESLLGTEPHPIGRPALQTLRDAGFKATINRGFPPRKESTDE